MFTDPLAKAVAFLLACLQGMKYAPLTWLEPATYVLEDLHTRLNLVRTHLAHTAKLASEVRVSLDGELQRALGFKRPTLGYEGHQCWLVLERRMQWLQPLREHRQFPAIKRRWDLITALVTITHTPNPSVRQIEHFGVLAERLGALLKQHWGEGAAFPYYFVVYDHGLLCHAHGQLQRYGSLFKFSTWIFGAHEQVVEALHYPA